MQIFDDKLYSADSSLFVFIFHWTIFEDLINLQNAYRCKCHTEYNNNSRDDRQRETDALARDTHIQTLNGFPFIHVNVSIAR